MLMWLLLFLLLIVVFGSLGVFVAKLFFVVLAVALLVSILSGGLYARRR
jgi:hypothetical protein